MAQTRTAFLDELQCRLAYWKSISTYDVNDPPQISVISYDPELETKPFEEPFPEIFTCQPEAPKPTLEELMRLQDDQIATLKVEQELRKQIVQLPPPLYIGTMDPTQLGYSDALLVTDSGLVFLKAGKVQFQTGVNVLRQSNDTRKRARKST